MTRAGRSILLWGAAFAIAVTLGVFQRMTGPTYPRSVEVPAGAGSLELVLPRTHGGDGGLRIVVPRHGEVSGGRVLWRRYPTAEPWRTEALRPGERGIEAVIPHQPPAGKVEYRLVLDTSAGPRSVPAAGTVVARFRGDVPASVLIPHILIMFASMLLATSAVLVLLFDRERRARGRILLAMATLVVGGLILGPAVQWHAFGAWWTGWPLGTDLTDNKTLLAVIAWLPATILALARRRTTTAAVAGWLVMMAVFLIPHSLGGSEIDWSAQGEAATAAPADVSP